MQNESLNIYLFDSLNPIELDVRAQNEAKLSNREVSKDLIGICTIPLKGLLTNDLVQGEFPIFNMDNIRVGKLAINIIWEEIHVGINEGLMNSLNYKTEIKQDNLVIKLANCLKEKGLNIESAFNIFDIDKNREISLENFKNTIIFTLKFTTNQNEMEHLIKIFFMNQGRSKLDKIDFYKIFVNLLPSEEMKQSQNINNNGNININSPATINSNIPSKNIVNNNIIDNKLTTNIDYYSNKQLAQTGQKNNSEKTQNDRNLNEIGKLISKYKLKGKSKSDAVDIFKYIFDKDASLGIDKNELVRGFEKMGINLSENEKNNLWKKMAGNKGSIDFESFKIFHDNYCISSKENTIQSDKSKIGSVSSGGFLSDVYANQGK